MLDQIIKDHYIALHNTTLLAQENATPHIANEKVVKNVISQIRKYPAKRA
jgi:hypothetical protein